MAHSPNVEFNGPRASSVAAQLLASPTGGISNQLLDWLRRFDALRGAHFPAA